MRKTFTLRQVSLLALVCLLMAVRIIGAPASGFEPRRLTPVQLLDPFAKTQDWLRSCAYSVTTEEVFSGGRGGTRKLFYQADIRIDTTRAELRQYRWGDLTLPAGSKRGSAQYARFSRDRAEYRHELWTPTNHFEYRIWDTPYWAAYPKEDPRQGTLKITRESNAPSEPRRKLMAGQFGAAGYLFGYLRGDDDRCDVELKSASEPQVRQRREVVNGVPCWVLEARRTHGKWIKHYTLWFDPVHGYNLARIRTYTETSDGRDGPWGESDLKQVQFRQINGVWVPIQAEEDYVQCRDPRRPKTTGKLRIRITAMRINPDHEAAKSFRLDDVREGTAVRLIGDDRRVANRGTWRGGSVLGKDGAILCRISLSSSR